MDKKIANSVYIFAWFLLILGGIGLTNAQSRGNGAIIVGLGFIVALLWSNLPGAQRPKVPPGADARLVGYNGPFFPFAEELRNALAIHGKHTTVELLEKIAMANAAYSYKRLGVRTSDGHEWLVSLHFELEGEVAILFPDDSEHKPDRPIAVYTTGDYSSQIPWLMTSLIAQTYKLAIRNTETSA
jgi:hypothetical protein